MSQLLSVTLNGLTLAGVYFLIASGLTLIFGLMRVITMAHGTSYLVGGYFGYTVAKLTDSWLIGAVAATVAVGVVGFIIHQVFIRKFQHDDMRVALITLGISLVGTDLMAATYGGFAYQVPAPESWLGSVDVPGIGSYPKLRLIMLLIAIIIGVGLWLFINKTRFGAIVRAGVDDSDMTSATGVNTKLVFAVVFIMGSALAGFAGVANGTLFTLLPGQDGTFLLYSLIVVIVGGMGSIVGAAIGALLLGLVSQFGLLYAPTYASFMTFGLLVLVLAVRPQGIMGRILK